MFRLIHFINSIDIKCDFQEVYFNKVPLQYTCIVENNLNITHKCTVIKSIQGSHEESQSIDNVTGISINDRKVHFIPTNLGEKFKKLIAIQIKHGRIKEIHKNDLKQFTKLQFLNLDSNDIEALEEGLFEFNPELILIWMENNNIISIGQTTFKNLNKLEDLDLSRNDCFSMRFESFMAENITLINEACYNATARILYNILDPKCQFVDKDKKLKLSQEKIHKLQKELDENIKLQKQLQEKTSRHFWMLVIELPINFVLLIINVVLVFKL